LFPLEKFLHSTTRHNYEDEDPVTATIKLIYHECEAVGKRLRQFRAHLLYISDTNADELRMTRTIELAGKSVWSPGEQASPGLTGGVTAYFDQ
jgi:hypothetical protein